MYLRNIALCSILSLPLLSAASGCGKALTNGLTPGGTSQPRSIQSSGGTRSYRVFVPQNYNINTPSPVILVYHGSGADGGNAEYISELSLSKWNTDHVVIYPDGYNTNWEGPSYATPGISDIQFTSDLIDAVQAELCTIPERFYAAGYSNGGGFTGLMTCDAGLTSKIRAFATLAGAFYNQFPSTSCNPSRRPIPIMNFHGEADGVIPSVGGTGRGGPLPSVPVWIAQKAFQNGCANSSTPETRELLQGNNVIKDTWHCGNSRRVLVRFNETLMAHTWVGGPGQTEPRNGLVAATPEILQFFREWS